MIRHTTPVLFFTAIALSAVLIALLTSVEETTVLYGRVLEGEAFLETQAKSDFDHDGDIDFTDFTRFAALYEDGN